MSINAPQVRSASLPTQTPNVNRQPIRAAQPTEAASETVEDTQTAAEAAPGEKPRRKYNRKPKPQLTGDVEGLTKEEQAAVGRIAVKALRAGKSPDKYMQSVIAEYGEEIAVYQKLWGSVPAETAETEEQPAAQA